jgi:hypothetical protein
MHVSGGHPLGWWTLSGEDLLDLLRRAHGGEHPDVIFAEEAANAVPDGEVGSVPNELREAVEWALAYTDVHRYSDPGHGHDCYIEWQLARNEVTRLLGGRTLGQDGHDD